MGGLTCPLCLVWSEYPKKVPAKCMVSSEFHLERASTNTNIWVRNAPSQVAKYCNSIDEVKL